MADTLTGMADAGADIAKLAVMPRCAADAARLLEATARAADARPDTPLITMSMGPLGAVTRFCGGSLGLFLFHNFGAPRGSPLLDAVFFFEKKKNAKYALLVHPSHVSSYINFPCSQEPI